jgi:cbb3-type cytochrome oxidase subunit 3
MDWNTIIESLHAPLSLLMLLLFVALAWWTFSPRRRDRLNDCARIPLRDEDR